MKGSKQQQQKEKLDAVVRVKFDTEALRQTFGPTAEAKKVASAITWAACWSSVGILAPKVGHCEGVTTLSFGCSSQTRCMVSQWYERNLNTGKDGKVEIRPLNDPSGKKSVAINSLETGSPSTAEMEQAKKKAEQERCATEQMERRLQDIVANLKACDAEELTSLMHRIYSGNPALFARLSDVMEAERKRQAGFGLLACANTH